MARRPARTVLLSALLPAALVAGTGLAGPTLGTAAAESVTVTDGRGDVWFYGAGPDGPTWVQVPDRAEEDVRSVRIDLEPRRLVLTTRVRDLPDPDTTPGAGPKHTVERSEGRDLYVSVDLTGGQTSMTVYTGDEVRAQCNDDNAVLDVDRRTDRVEVSLTGRCLGRPSWVRVATEDVSVTGRNSYVDAVGNDGHERGTRSARVRAG